LAIRFSNRHVTVGMDSDASLDRTGATGRTGVTATRRELLKMLPLAGVGFLFTARGRDAEAAFSDRVARELFRCRRLFRTLGTVHRRLGRGRQFRRRADNGVPRSRPLRLVMPTKRRYKQDKYIVRLKVTNVLTTKTRYWEDRGYPWYGGL
jgi:hypothetical protein